MARNERLLAAFDFLVHEEGTGNIFTIEALADDVGWSRSTALTYLAKRWAPLLERVPGGYRVKPGLRIVGQEQFLAITTGAHAAAFGADAFEPRRCFLSCPASSALRPLVADVLQSSGYQLVDLGASLAAGRSVHEELVAAIGGSALVIGVAEGTFSPNVAFELGIATALSKATAIIVTKEVSVPMVLRHMMVLQATEVNRDGLTFILNQFLQGSSSSPRHAKVETVTTPPALGSAHRQFLQRLEGANNERALERLAHDLLVATGIEVFQRQERSGVDLAAWIDETHALFGNPILVDVRVALKRQEDLELIVGKMDSLMELRGAHTSLVLCKALNRSLAGVTYLSSGQVFVVAFDELIQTLGHQSVGRALVSIRNRLAHVVS